MITRIGVAVLLVLPTAAFAQGNPGPFGGLFGRTPDRVGKEYRVFEVRTMATGQYEDAVNDGSTPAEERVQSRGMATGGVSGLFAQRSTRLTLSARTNANYLQYIEQPYPGGTSVESSVNATFEVATRLALHAEASYFFTPLFQFHPQFFSWAADGSLVPPSSPYVATSTEHQSYGFAGGFATPYSKHSTFGAAIERRDMRFTAHPELDMAMSGVRADWTRRLHRGLSLRLGYRRDLARFRDDDDRLIESYDAGIDVVRAMSPGRRTGFAITTRTAKLWTPEMGRRWRLDGAVDVSRWFRRTWLLALQAKRTTEFAPGFVEPLLADTAGVKWSGMLSRRAEAVVQVNGGRGQVGFDATPERFTIAVATSQFTYAVSRHIGLFLQHSFFYYELPQGASPAAPLAYLNRQTTTIGFTTWIPIYTRERSPSDTR